MATRGLTSIDGKGISGESSAQDRRWGGIAHQTCLARLGSGPQGLLHCGDPGYAVAMGRRHRSWRDQAAAPSLTREQAVAPGGERRG